MTRRQFGTVRRRQNGRWQARYTDLDGRQKNAPETFATKADALAWLSALQTDRNRGNFFDPHAGTSLLSDYAESWIKARLVRGRPLGPRTQELYRSQLRLHINPTLGSYELRRLTPALIRAWHGRMTLANDPGPSTRAKCYRLLRAICTTAVEDELILKNPVAIRGAGQEPENERPMFSIDQVDDLVAATDERWRALFLLAGWAGLRFSELAALRHDDLDLVAGFVRVDEAAVDVAGRARSYERPKSDAGARSVALPPHVIPELRKHLETYGETGKHGLVFVGPKGGVLRRSNFNKSVWQPARKAAKLPAHAHLHDLRGFSATTAAQQGATTKELMHRLGHSSTNAAMRYQRAEMQRDKALAEAMSAMARRRSGPSKAQADSA